MKKVLKKLCELQAVDSDIAAFRIKLIEIPKKEQTSDENVKRAEEIVQDIDAELRKKEIFRETTERETREARMSLSKHNTQLLMAKTNREYSALLKEIEEEQKSIEKAEEETITNIMEMEELSKKLEKRKKELEEIKRKEKAERENLSKMRKQLEMEIEQKSAERQQIATHISASYLTTYERIRKGRGNAVVTVKDGMCTGCNTLLPPQFITLVRNGRKIYTCEQCGRILVWHEDVE